MGLGDITGNAQLFYEALRFIYMNRPLTAFIENSGHLITYNQGQFMRAVVKLLVEWGYNVTPMQMWTEDYGL